MSHDPIYEMQRLIYEILSDPCWRGSRLPTGEGLDTEIRQTMDQIVHEFAHLKTIIMKQEDTIRRLSTALVDKRYHHEQ